VKSAERLIDSVYARLRDMILINELRAGQKLTDRDLAEHLGVSRTPVREALGRLAMVGLVEVRNRRGFYVRQYSQEEVSDIYEFRKILEVNAARLAARNAKPEHIAEFDRILARLESLSGGSTNYVKIVELDLRIHRFIGEASCNSALNEAIQNLMDKVMCFLWVDWADPAGASAEAVATANQEHSELIHMIKNGNADGAAELLGRHIDNAQNVMAQLLKSRKELRSAVLAGNVPTVI
jgi:DNA-binding GntR family transcriptional regulator